MASFQVDQLEALLRKGGTATTPEYRTALERLYIELTVRESRSLRESRDFFLATVNVLKRQKGSGNWELRLRCLYLCWRFFFFHGDSVTTLHIAEVYRQLADKAESRTGQRLAYNLLGIAHGDIGNIEDALRAYLQGIEIAKLMNDLKAQCSLLNNIGTALNYAGLYVEATSCFQTVIAIAQKDWNNHPGEYALSNLAQSYYYLDDLPSALDAIDRSLRNSNEPATAEAYCQQTIREFMYVQIALELRLQDLAHQHLEACRRRAISADTERCKTMFAIAAARCEVASGRIEKGLQALEHILLKSRELDSCYRDALIAIVKAYDDAGCPESALRHMESLVAYECERRTVGTEILLSMAERGLLSKPAVGRRSTTQTLEQKHASLRARVAERQAESFKSEMLERLAGTADLRDDASGEHGFRVGRLAGLLASRIGWSDHRARSLESAARLHDIGKIAIPDRILRSSQSLKEIERNFIALHTTIGAELLAKSAAPQLQLAEQIARHHHERWDGSGYPDKLTGRQIPIHARMVALADVFDALTHGRPYSPPWTAERAVDEIRRQRGRHFDPHLTDVFLELVLDLQGAHRDLDTFLSESAGDLPMANIRRTICRLLQQGQEGMEGTTLQ